MIVVASYGKEFRMEPVEGRTVLTLVNDTVKIPELDGIPFQCQAGTCKRCVVSVQEGHEYLASPSEVEKQALGPRLEKGYRLACQTRVVNQKKYLRQKLIQQRETLDPELRRTYDQAILKHCLAHPAVKEARSVMAYLDFRGEVGTRGLIERLWQMGKTVYLPVTDSGKKELTSVAFADFGQLQEGAYGIPEPDISVVAAAGNSDKNSTISSLDVVFVPGVAFRTDGGRIGYGGGYYDRFLAKLHEHTIKIGLAYQLQINETFPVVEHDVMMDFVVTQKKVYRSKW